MNCVIFDMDGVIVDSELIHQKCEREMFDILDIPVTTEQHNSMVGRTDEDMWRQIGSWYDLPVTVDKAISMKKTLFLQHLNDDDSILTVPYVEKFIEELFKNGFVLALASSSSRNQIERILGKFNLEKFFSAVVSGDDVQRGKPDPEIFLKVTELFIIDPASCVVIEDSVNGVVAAKAANMKCIGYLNPNSGRQDLSKADMIIASFSDLSILKVYELAKK
jgi:beta-phosphoglucomutase family hydrolase